MADSADVKKEILQVFHALDLNADGCISRDELACLLKALDKDTWNDERLQNIITAADANCDGLIQYVEFLDWVSGGSDAGALDSWTSLITRCPPGLTPCRYGDACWNKDPKHKRRFWHAVPSNYDEVAKMRSACRFGFKCYQRTAAHMEQYVHPGDRNYKKGLVSFGRRGPEFDTLWQLFGYYDTDESGHLTVDECKEAARHFKHLGAANVPVIEAIMERINAVDGYVNFGRFCVAAESCGVNLPVGVDNEGEAKPCHFRLMKKNGYSCGCAEFRASDHGLCECGHKQSLHRSNSSTSSRAKQLSEKITSTWLTGGTGLVEVGDEELLRKIQELFDSTHKTTDNWTRDRGCSIHGRSHPECNLVCIRKNGNRVPTKFYVKKVFRNQNHDVVEAYTMAKNSILKECSSECNSPYQHVAVVSSRPVVGLDELSQDCNEWRLFHGTTIEACRGICNTNFRLSLSGTGATWKDPGAETGSPLYGFGIYLAERITKADEYSERLPDSERDAGLNPMLLVRCVGGRTNIVTTNEIDKVQLRKDVFDGPHHSVLGDRVVNLGKPYREIVVYDKDQIFPEYLVLYERCHG